ncbi:nucleolar protein 14 [Tuber indicum]|nr:nucleolar protein 14 [Tuber indicum]
MPESQLKRLKASLRTAGITGQQKSKKAAKKQRKSTIKHDSRLDRHATLQTIREEFNPFEIKTTREKHAVIGRGKAKGAQGRPSLSKQIGEENRKRTLLVEMQKRNKAGGILDRRFGENDPTMTPEEKMLQRFTKEKQKRVRGGDIFNLDDDDELTHFGQSLGGLTDDFDVSQNDLMLSDDEPTRKRPLDTEGLGDEDASPGRKKSKTEVMKEVIAKSKLHKYERQKVKEDDEEEREKLDAQMNDIWALLGAKKPSTTGPATGANNEPVPGREEVKVKSEADPSINPERLARMEGREYDYDVAVREMAFDKRSKPSERTKTEEEKLQEESERLKKLEEVRQKRMRGEDSGGEKEALGGDDEVDLGDAAEYGLGAGVPMAPVGGNFNPDELVDGDYEASEDGYIDVDENGEANASDTEQLDDYNSDYSSVGGSDDEPEEGEDDDFLEALGSQSGRVGTGPGVLDLSKVDGKYNKLAFTFPCPQTHEEFLEIVRDIPIDDLPTVVQRIRVLYHPKLDAENKHKLARFSEILLQHILLVANKAPSAPPFKPLETLIRHLHALAKSYPDTVSRAFREHLNIIHEQRSTGDLKAGDLILFTAISTIFPTSDHFHQVVTPAMIVICQWLGQVSPNSLSRLGVGTYLVTMCVQYQRLSKRYVPEATHFVLRALSLLAPVRQEKLSGTFPYEEPEASLRIQKPPQKETMEARKMNFADIFGAEKSGADMRDIQLSLLATLASLLESMAGLWVGKTAFTMIFEPALEIIEHLLHKSNKSAIGGTYREKLLATKSYLESRILHARKSLRPLTLHYHRPLPIKTYIPKFEEAYSLDKRSYDPNSDRAALSKLKAEHKREKKGALRELRKDSRFIAREKLKEDKKTSKEYHEKMRKLTAMIQTEEGAAGNEYKKAKGRK